MNILAVVSAKGGVGKTTLAANISAALQRERRVLCVDLDPQNALRLHLGVAMDEYDGLSRCTLEKRQWDTAIFQSPGSPEVLPYGSIDEGDRLVFEQHLFANPDWLASQLRELNIGENDCVVIDTPPGPSLYLQQALRVAKYVAVVVHPDASSYATLPSMERQLDKYARGRADFFGSAYILNNVSAHQALTRDILDIMSTGLGERLCPYHVHQDESVREALASDSLIATYDPHCVATHDIERCSEWLAERLFAKAPPDNRT